MTTTEKLPRNNGEKLEATNSLQNEIGAINWQDSMMQGIDAYLENGRSHIEHLL